MKHQKTGEPMVPVPEHLKKKAFNDDRVGLFVDGRGDVWLTERDIALLADEPRSGAVEPVIVMNGVQLSYAQSMMVRVAIESFSFGCHGTGHEIDRLYMERIDEVRPIMYANNPHYAKE